MKITRILTSTVLAMAIAGALFMTPATASARVFVSVGIAPPPIPIYAQPIAPGDGYIWAPGYWAYGDDGYYWVDGSWVDPPYEGALWTPGYWGWGDDDYFWNPGYWGLSVGYYGGINYGFGYGGVGFAGGEWRGGAFFYNRAVMNINVRNVTNVYSKTVVVNNTHVAFNGPGGIEARPTRQEEEYGREHHTEALATQRDHEHAASQNRELFARENHGRPAIAATGRPGEFSGHDVVRSRAAGAAYHEPKMSPREARAEGGNQSEPARNEPARNAERNDRPAARAENNRAENRAPQTKNNETRNNEARNHQARNNEARNQARNSEAGNRGQKASHESSRPARQEKAQKQARPEKPAKQAKSEPKHEGRR
jgi:hypothetical protein